MRTCKFCNAEKDDSQFSKTYGVTTGRVCRDCHRERQRHQMRELRGKTTGYPDMASGSRWSFEGREFSIVKLLKTDSGYRVITSDGFHLWASNLRRDGKKLEDSHVE